MFTHTIVRQPLQAGCYSDRTEYTVQITGVREDRGIGYLLIRFCTNNRRGHGSEFTMRPTGAAFEDWAKEMMKADPQAAIKAFGAALRDANIAVRPDEREETKAA